MAKLVFGMMQSLDGYVAGVADGPQLPPPGEMLHRHFNDLVRGLSGSLYGRRMYEVMRYWDDDEPAWGDVERDFAAAWRPKPKWVASRTLKSVGANATLVAGDLGDFVRRLKAEVDGEIDVAGPELRAASRSWASSTSTGSICGRSCSAAASPTSPAPGRRSRSSPRTASARMPSG
jgi:dihydrofolate reductase